MFCVHTSMAGVKIRSTYILGSLQTSKCSRGVAEVSAARWHFASVLWELWAGEASAQGTLSAVFGVKATLNPDVTASNPGAAL